MDELNRKLLKAVKAVFYLNLVLSIVLIGFSIYLHSQLTRQQNDTAQKLASGFQRLALKIQREKDPEKLRNYASSLLNNSTHDWAELVGIMTRLDNGFRVLGLFPLGTAVIAGSALLAHRRRKGAT